eukprot:GHVS01052875.1.p1 GENE.GHVS01052875.1~~GHVS01052875.1.p1  ORF type:complete len:167 (+),score=18.58 GHVS01052875.1:3-503(+)
MLPSSTGGADSKAAKNAPIVIVATDNTKTVSLVMQGVRDVDKNIVFGSIPLTDKGNRFSIFTGSKVVLKQMYKRHGNCAETFDRDSWCKYLNTPVQDYKPMALSIDVSAQSGLVLFGEGLDEFEDEEMQYINIHNKAKFSDKKKEDHRMVIWCFHRIKFHEKYCWC